MTNTFSIDYGAEEFLGQVLISKKVLLKRIGKRSRSTERESPMR